MEKHYRYKYSEIPKPLSKVGILFKFKELAKEPLPIETYNPAKVRNSQIWKLRGAIQYIKYTNIPMEVLVTAGLGTVEIDYFKNTLQRLTTAMDDMRYTIPICLRCKHTITGGVTRIARSISGTCTICHSDIPLTTIRKDYKPKH